MSYIIRPKGMPDYFFCGSVVGFSRIRRSAVQYVSLEVARLAARVVEDKIRKRFPACKELTVEKYARY